MSERAQLDFSLIVATLGRTHELDALLRSLATQTFQTSRFEVIVVDQNSDDRLTSIVAQHARALTIRHIRSSRLGSSHNRNLGIEHAHGRWITFPDDDCTYYTDTLQKTHDFLVSHPQIDMVFGAIVDRATGERIIRSWPLRETVITARNYFFLYSQITLFCKPSALRFDERLGPATPYGAYEDADFVYSAIQMGQRLHYTPSIELWHPKQGVGHMAVEKTVSYSRGLGAFVAKHADVSVYGLFVKSVVYHLAMLLPELLLLRFGRARTRWVTVIGRIQGYVRFRRQYGHSSG
jgi:glycosyltransferase involved in cell wall biosynthesis